TIPAAPVTKSLGGLRGFRKPLPTIDRDVRLAAGAGVVRPWADEPVVGVLLEHVSGPADDPAHGEDWRELIGGDAHRLVGGAGVEVDVGIDVLELGDHGGHGIEDLDRARVPRLTSELSGEPTQVLGAGILDTVDAMPDAHEPHLVADGLADT